MQNKETLADNSSTLPLVVGVDLGGTQIRTAVLQGSTLLSRVGLLTGDNATPERIIPRIYDAIQQALDKARISLQDIPGIGIGAPGPLDSTTGIVFDPPNLAGWNHVPLRDIFQEHYHLPVFVENDANAAALGEYMFGAGQGSRSMVYMTVSTGIGGGVILNGKIMEGASGTAAELGHMTIDRHGERCTCGNIGCLEYISSGTSIARHANEVLPLPEGSELLAFAKKMQEANPVVGNQPTLALPGQHQSPEDIEPYMTASMVGQAAEAGIPIAHAIIEDAAEALGVGLVNIIHIFNPEMIILGGGVTQMGPIFLEPVLRVVKERAMQVPRDAVRIVQAQLGVNVGLIGAGALIYYHNQQQQQQTVTDHDSAERTA